MVKQISDNEIYLLIKYTKNVLWRVVKRLSYIQDARCLKVKVMSCGLGEHCLILRKDRYFSFISVWLLPPNLMVWNGISCDS